ncbi:MAG TPA: WYL domain-containing protein [Planctomycetaceae bacterium]|nr:WYL domain-containing protein [Planctomycetaceae bacterium]
MARNEQLIRQHKILQILERLRFGATLEELRNCVVEELGLTSLHTRSIRRDLEALTAAGIPITDEENQRGRIWKLSRSDKGLHKITITASELIALSMGRDLMLPLVGTQFWIGIESFWNKVGDQLPGSVWEHYERYRRTMYVLGLPFKTYEKHQGILKTVNRAIQEHRELEMEYQVPGRTATTRTIEPYGVVLYQSSIYVVATETARESDSSAGSQKLKHWKLDRFQSAKALDTWFKPDPEIDLGAHLGQSVGIFSGAQTTQYVLKLSPQAARWIEEDPWHPEQTLTPQDDGSVLLKVSAFHDTEIIQRAMRLGAEAEVLEPAECRDKVKEILADLVTRYD